MAIFTFRCPEHGQFTKALLKGQKMIECPKCNSLSKRVLAIGTSKVVEVIDNGLMIKAVERPVDIEELMIQREEAYKVNGEEN